jgi:integrase
MARFKYYDRYFVIRYLKYDKELPYYRRRVPNELVNIIDEKEIIIRLYEKNGSLEGQCRRLGDEHTTLFKQLRLDPNHYGTNKARINALLSKYGAWAGMGINPLPNSQNSGSEFSRTPHLDDFFMYYLHRKEAGQLTKLDEDALNALRDGYPALLSDVKRIYLDDPRDGKWRSSSIAYWDKLIAFKGDMLLTAFTPQLAKDYLGLRLKEGAKTQTVQKELNIFRSGFNKAMLELGITAGNNPFKNLSPPRLGKDATKKLTLTQEQIRLILAAPACENKNFALIQMATGARISEVAGARVQDFDRNTGALTIIDYEDQTLKTENSRRTTPLLDFALKAVDDSLSGSVVLFPRYSDGKSKTKGGNASANINNWLRSLLGPNISSHCFRHTLTTLLKNADTPQDLREEITGHSQQATSANYGEVSSLKRKREALERAFSFLYTRD